MNGYLLDTNVPSELIQTRPNGAVEEWVKAQKLELLFISAISFGELRKGIALREPGKPREQLERWLQIDMQALFAGRILPVTQAIAECWGELEARRQGMGRPLSVPDAQIAASRVDASDPEYKRLRGLGSIGPQSVGDQGLGS